jgi:hypothetical protein
MTELKAIKEGLGITSEPLPTKTPAAIIIYAYYLDPDTLTTKLHKVFIDKADDATSYGLQFNSRALGGGYYSNELEEDFCSCKYHYHIEVLKYGNPKMGMLREKYNHLPQYLSRHKEQLLASFNETT